MPIAEKIATLKDGSAVADLAGRRQGRVLTVLRKNVYRVEWEDGQIEVVERAALLSRFVTTTPEPKKKTWRRLVPTTKAAK